MGNTHCRFWDGIRILFFAKINKIVALKCSISLFPMDEVIKSWTIDEFEKIENIYEELENINKLWPEHHHFETMEYRCPTSGKCWCDPSEIKFSHIEVSLLYNCNLHCRFCGAEYDRQGVKDLGQMERLQKIYLKTLESLKGHNLEYIRLTDQGEPFFPYSETVNYLKSLTPADTKQVQITTNGTLLSDEVINIIETSNVDILLTISLNAYNKEHYKTKMGVDAFEHVLDKIEKLKSKNQMFKVSFLIDEFDDAELKSYIPIFNSLLEKHIWFGVFPANQYSDKIVENKTYQQLYNMSITSINQFTQDVNGNKFILKATERDWIVKNYF